MTGTSDEGTGVVEDNSALEWEVREWEKHPEKRWVVLVVALLAAAYALFVLRQPILALIGASIIFISTAEMFLPVRHRLDSKGASRKCGLSTTALDWADTRRIIEGTEVIRVSPLEKASRLDAFRGVPLKLSGNRDAVLAKIRELWQRDEHSLAGETGQGGGERADREAGGRDSSPQAGDTGDPVP